MGEYDDVGGVFELKVNGVLYNLKGQPTIELGGTYREPHGGEFTVAALATRSLATTRAGFPELSRIPMRSTLLNSRTPRTLP